MSIVRIGRDEAGVRLDRWLRGRLAFKSLSEIYMLIRKGRVRVNGKRSLQNYRLCEGDTVEAEVKQEELEGGEHEPSQHLVEMVNSPFFQRNFKVIFEDENLIVCDKPVNLVVHGGTGHLRYDSLIDLATSYLYRKSRTTAFQKPVLVHRIDRDTSGVVLVAKNKRTLRSLHEEFRQGRVVKQYAAVCHGTPQPPQATVELDLVRTYDPREGTRVRVEHGGKHSKSSYRVLDTRPNLSRLDIDLGTGRTHQIRVHMAHIGCPVVGDIVYGDAARDAKVLGLAGLGEARLYLHAQSISFHYPVLGGNVTFEAPLPPQFAALWKAAGKRS